MEGFVWKDAASLVRSDGLKTNGAAGLLYRFDIEQSRQEGGKIIGVDEAGRGPLAGPVVAAAVMLDYKEPIYGIDDSKRLSPERRERLYEQITAGAAAWAVGEASVEEIDGMNILGATFTAMYRAICGIKPMWQTALIDGNKVVPQLPDRNQRAVVGGDRKSACVAAASIVAKVTRDRMMSDFHRVYPQYRFDLHKGYGTRLHRSLIERFGLCPIHRRKFCVNFIIHQTRIDI